MANFIDVARFRGSFGTGAQSTEPIAMITKSGQLILNTYTARAFGVDGKTKQISVGITWDGDTRRVRIYNSHIKSVDNVFGIRNMGWKSKEAQAANPKTKSGPGQLMAGLSGIWMNKDVGILYDFKKSGNQRFECSEFPVSKKDSRVWGIEFELPEGVHPDASNGEEKPAKRKREEEKPLRKLNVGDDDEDEDEDENESEDEESDEDEDEDADSGGDDDEDEDEDEEPVKPAKRDKAGKAGKRGKR